MHYVASLIISHYWGSMCPSQVGHFVESSYNNQVITNFSDDNFSDPFDIWCILSDLRVNNHHKIIIGYLNINSISNKFDALKMVIPGNIDLLVVTETKIDASFEITQFCVVDFNEPYRLDGNRNGGGIPTRLLKLHTFHIEGIFLEMNLCKTKWILYGTYHPPGQDDNYFFGHLGQTLDIYSDIYDKFLLAGEFNEEEGESCLDTCFKDIENPSCIDLFITNSVHSFQNTKTISTGLSDCHQMVVTVLKTTFQKSKPREITYRKYSKFNEVTFRENLKAQFIENKTLG